MARILNLVIVILELIAFSKVWKRTGFKKRKDFKATL